MAGPVQVGARTVTVPGALWAVPHAFLTRTKYAVFAVNGAVW
jgi:hypothetical protein